MLNIKTIRTNRGLNQQAVADYLKIARPTYTNIENGRSDPDTGTLLKLSKLFKCSIDELFGIKRETAISLNSSQSALLNTFDQLNPQGQQLVLDYAAMLAANQDYTKETASTVSA